MPKELDNIHSGGCMIDGVRCSVWREVVLDPRYTQEQFDSMSFMERRGVECKNAIIPDVEVEEMERSFGATNSYDWKVKHWGVKWDACEGSIDEMTDQRFTVRFDAPWGPPVLWLRKVCLDFPTLKFELAFAEGGMGYWGVISTQNGDEAEDYHEAGFWKKVQDEDADIEDYVSDACRSHLDHYGLHTGG
jgi:hypothetical protein